MSIDSFGYQVASLNELIEELTTRRDVVIVYGGIS